MSTYLFIILFFISIGQSSIAGLFSPKESDLKKNITAPVAGKSDMSVSDFVNQIEGSTGKNGSWSGNTYVIEVRDKNTLKMTKTKFVFEFTDTEALLTEIHSGKDKLEGQYVGATFYSIYSESPKAKARKKKEEEAQQAQDAKRATEEKLQMEASNKKQKEQEAAEIFQRDKAEQAKALKENNERNRKAITVITALAGKYCGSNGTKIEIADDGKSNIILSVSENKCSMTKKSLPVIRHTDGSDSVEVKLADSVDAYRNCSMTIRPTVDAGKKSVGLGVDCDDNIAKQTLGCDYGNLITTFESCN